MENHNPPTKPVGIFLTLDKMYDKLVKIDEDINNRMRKMESQIAVLWVINGIVIATIIAVITQKVSD